MRNRKTCAMFFGYVLLLLIFLTSLCVLIVPAVGILTSQSRVIIDFPGLLGLQRYFYFGGVRNIWQYDPTCAQPDATLVYAPALGHCRFSNIEFDTTLSFGELGRENDSLKLYSGPGIAVLGDSHAMGWGVEDEETFSAILGKLLKKPVSNYAVSSYATEQELERLIRAPNADSLTTILIQYCENDFGSNKNFPFDRLVANQRYREAKSSYGRDGANIAELSIAFPSELKRRVSDFFRAKLVDTKISTESHKVQILNVLDRYSEFLKGKKIVIFYSNSFGKSFLSWDSKVDRDKYSVSFVDLHLDSNYSETYPF